MTLKEVKAAAVARRAKVAEMRAAGLKNAEIAERLGITMRCLHNDVYAARKFGLMPKFKKMDAPRSLMAVAARSGIRAGTMDGIYRALDTPVRVWLLEQVPTGATMSETIAAIIVDTYHEERGE